MPVEPSIPLERHPKIVVAIPCLNEESFIGEVVEATKRYADQVIVVDDGSTDNTAGVAEAAGALVVRHETNRGYGGAIRSCFKAARDNNADILVTIDGDGQHRAAELPRLLSPLLGSQADVVIGSRFLGAGGNMPRYRRFGIGVITWLFNLGSRVKVSDAQSGFRAYRGKVLEAVSPTQKGMSISIEVLLQAREKGFAIAEAPISCHYHPGSSTLNPILHGLGVALAVVKLRLRSALRRLARGRLRP